MVMEEKVNIAEILKDKPQGTSLYDLLRNIDVKLDEVHITDVGTYIECTSTNEVGSTFLFDYSKLGTEESWLDGLQILLPSKEMRDWSKLAWNTGDILVNKDGNAHVIFEGFDGCKDHRITKAISLVEYWNARRYRNEAAKFNKKDPFRPRDLRRSVERLKQYSV